MSNRFGDLSGTNSGEHDVSECLTQTARLVAATVDPGGDVSCGITLRLRTHYPLMRAFSDNRARGMDEPQDGVGEGPCLHALRTGQLVLIDDLATGTTWEPYCERGLARGARSWLSVPIAGEGVAAAMNLYAGQPHRFEQEAIDQAVALAHDVRTAIMLAVRIGGYVELAGQLRAALVSRTVIDQAIGMIMGQNRCTAQAAFEVLNAASQHRNVKLRDLATHLVAGASDPDLAQHQ